MSECKRFNDLKRKIESECKAHKIKSNATNYLVNKVAKLVTKSKVDTLEVYVSLFYFTDNGEEFTTKLTIPFSDGELFITFVVGD